MPVQLSGSILLVKAHWFVLPPALPSRAAGCPRASILGRCIEGSPLLVLESSYGSVGAASSCVAYLCSQSIPGSLKPEAGNEADHCTQALHLLDSKQNSHGVTCVLQR